MRSVSESPHLTLPDIEIADLVWQPSGADAPTLDLRGSRIHVAAGETLLISGASGAGKSTLVAAIAGLLGTLLPGTLHGTLRVGGSDLVAAATEGAAGVPRELLDQLGFIAAGPAPRHALPRLLDDVALPLESRGVPADLLKSRAREAIVATGLPSDAAERDVASLSGGERAQAAAATGLVSTPGLVIADEPLAGLDATRARAIAALLMEQRATRVIVSHDAAQFGAATARLHLDRGRVVEPPAHQVESPRAPVAQLMGQRGSVALQLFAAASSARHGVGAVSATLHAGELLLVRGETGSGKSTILALAAGTLSVDAGERRVSASRIRYAPQDPGLLLGARSVHQLLPKVERPRAAEVAAALNVADLLDRPASRCSDGERRRLALVVTAAAEPDLLIADEPTLGLDDEAATRVSALLANLAARGVALLVATHDARLQMSHSRVLQHPDAPARAENPAEQPLAERGVELARELLTPKSVQWVIGVSNPLTRFGLAAFWFLLSVFSPATALAQGAVALPALIVAFSSGVRFISTLQLAAALAPAIAGMVIANLVGGATPEAAFGAGVRLVAFAAGSLVLL
ncbi:MAG: ATP-binding cassette domain-containing protein, partial [Chloroflexota bacterium]